MAHLTIVPRALPRPMGGLAIPIALMPVFTSSRSSCTRRAPPPAFNPPGGGQRRRVLKLARASIRHRAVSTHQV